MPGPFTGDPGAVPDACALPVGRKLVLPSTERIEYVDALPLSYGSLRPPFGFEPKTIRLRGEVARFCASATLTILFSRNPMGIIPTGRSMSLSAELPCRHPKQYAERPELSTPFRDGFSTAGAPLSARACMRGRARVRHVEGVAQAAPVVLISLSHRRPPKREES